MLTALAQAARARIDPGSDSAAKVETQMQAQPVPVDSEPRACGEFERGARVVVRPSSRTPHRRCRH